MTEIHDTSVGGGDAALRQQFADGAVGNTAFAQRSNVLFKRQQSRSTRLTITILSDELVGADTVPAPKPGVSTNSPPEPIGAETLEPLVK